MSFSRLDKAMVTIDEAIVRGQHNHRIGQFTCRIEFSEYCANHLVDGYHGFEFISEESFNALNLGFV
jgi:hypothetical protein